MAQPADTPSPSRSREPSRPQRPSLSSSISPLDTPEPWTVTSVPTTPTRAPRRSPSRILLSTPLAAEPDNDDSISSPKHAESNCSTPTPSPRPYGTAKTDASVIARLMSGSVSISSSPWEAAPAMDSSEGTQPEQGPKETVQQEGQEAVQQEAVQQEAVQQEAVQPEALQQEEAVQQESSRHVDEAADTDNKTRAPDAFDSAEDHEEMGEPGRVSVELDDLPIELIGLTDSFIGSLFAKVHSAPPSIDNLTRLFQEFYSNASSVIQTHLSALATRVSRDASPSRSRSSTASRLRAKAASLGNKDRPKLLGIIGTSTSTPGDSSVPNVSASFGGAQPLLTPDELAARKRARRALETKRLLMEEAVERRLCEGLYDRIYRHRSTQDEAQDEKLRSKTAALALVGIGLADLGINLGEDLAQTETSTPEEAAKKVADRTVEIKQWLAEARGFLVEMHKKRYPHGKLNMLKAAHKSIVDTLSHFHPSASADEIMPMLIYTLITMPPESLNVISDARFMQRFRWEIKLAGEAAYCLTNLEAAISFLETVDLSTLRESEHPSGPAKGVDGAKAETFPPAYPGMSAAATGQTPADSSAAAAAKPASVTTASALMAAAAQNKRLGDLVNMPAQAVNAASGAVFNTADQGLRTITTSLDASYKFLFGRLVERNNHEVAAAVAAANTTEEQLEARTSIVVPKTLDDARKLVSTPPLVGEDDEASLSGANSILGSEDAASSTSAAAGENRRPAREERMLSLIGGWRQAREHSADSSRSSVNSLKKVLFADAGSSASSATATSAMAASNTSTSPAAASNPAMLDSVRSLGSSLNPMARLSSISMIRGFGRTPLATPVQPPLQEATAAATAPAAAVVAPIPPPVARFMDVADAGELRLAEVAELLAEYRRLAGALGGMGAFGPTST